MCMELHGLGNLAECRKSLQVTHDVTDLTFASFLSEVGKKTDLTARFSTVVHERGSPETMRDVRGFSVKVMTANPAYSYLFQLRETCLCTHVCATTNDAFADVRCVPARSSTPMRVTGTS